MQIGTAKIDFEGLFIEGPAGRHSIEPKVMNLLGVLIENAQNVVTREELITAVWGVEYGGDERLSRGISLLRKAFGDVRGKHTHIETISKRGYRLIAQVSETGQPLSPSTPETTVKHKPYLEVGTPRPVKSRISIKRWLGIGGVTLAATLLISAGVMTLRPTGYFSVQASMEEGLGYIENFTAPNAIEDAQDIFGIILADNPDHAAARAGLAMALMREYTHLERDPATLQRAKATAEAALREDEHLALANIAMAWAELFYGDFEQVHLFLDRADILDPNNKFSLECRTATFAQHGKYDEAVAVLKQAIRHHPHYARFHLDLAELLSYKGELGQAEIIFKQGIALSKDNPRAYSQLGQILHMQDKTSEAIKIIQEGLKVGESAQLYNNLGTYLFFQGQYDLSAEAFKRTLEFDGNSHKYLYWANLADAYRWTHGRKQDANLAYIRAIQLLQTELDQNPANINLNSRAALYNAKLGTLDVAQPALTHVLSQDDLSSVVLYRAVVTFEILSDRSKALIMLDRAIEAGYPLTEIMNDPELKNLRQDPAYHQLLATKGNPL